MKAKTYIETTIVSYLVARPSRDLLLLTHQEITRDWWQSRRCHFDLYISELVMEEAAAGNPVVAQRRLEILADITILPQTPSVEVLAEDLIGEGVLPSKAAADAVHLALATVYGCEYLLTWNCRHLANAEIQRAARVIAGRHGFDLPTICTPEELMGGSQ
jgi:predicted nucleic acid-binding protein